MTGGLVRSSASSFSSMSGAWDAPATWNRSFLILLHLRKQTAATRPEMMMRSKERRITNK